MKKLLSFAAALLLVSGTLAWGIEPIAVENAGFDLPGIGNITDWDGPVDVNGWTSDGGAIGSGVQSDPTDDGNWIGLLLGGDPSVWQVTDHVIVADETLRFKVDGAGIGGMALLEMSLFAYDEIVDPNDPNIVTAVRTPIGIQDVALTSEMLTYTLECNVADAPEAVGNKLGIELRNVDKNMSLALIDNVKLFSIVPTGINIIWVTEETDNNGDGIRDDIGWVNWLEDEGHTVDDRPGYWMTFDPIDPNDANEVSKVDQLDAADLVIIGRATGSGNYVNDNEVATWNAVKTPMILLNSYLARNSRWGWVNTGDATIDAASVLEVTALDHPIFDGIALEQLNIVDPNTLIDPNDPNAPIVLPDPIYGFAAYDTTVGAGLTSFVGTLDAGNGLMIAQTDGTAFGAIAEWKSGIEYYSGAGQVSGDHRLLLCAGSQDSGSTVRGAWNLTADGATMLRNSIAHVLAQPLMARELQPASGTTGVALDATLSWRAGQLATMYAIYLSDNEDAVANSTALVDVVEGTSFALAPLKLDLGRTYYWKIDATDGEQTWPSEVQSFTTIDYAVVDDFESYTGDTIGGTWKDYWTHDGVDRGHSIVPDVNATVVLSGSQSMALSFNNATNPYYFDAYRTWSGANWTVGGARYLVINFHGFPGNHANENLWVKINGIRINYSGDGVQKDGWTQWVINVSSLNTPQWKIQKLDICVGDPPAPRGAVGSLYIDDIRLYRVAP